MSYGPEPFGPIADANARHRPGYPDASITWALEPVLRVPDLRVLDLGAGTGKLTEALLRVTGNVIAVEPDPGMRTEFVARVTGAVVLAGHAEAIPLPDERVHAVLIGQAAHWFDIPLAMREIARVLVPGGVVAALWNDSNPDTEWLMEFDRLCPRGDAGGLRRHPRLAPGELFTESAERTFDNVLRPETGREPFAVSMRTTVERAIRR